MTIPGVPWAASAEPRRCADRAVEIAQARPGVRGLERLDHVAEAHRSVAKLHGLPNRLRSRLTGSLAQGRGAATSQQARRERAPTFHRLAASLPAADHEAARRRLRTPRYVPRSKRRGARAREPERDPRLRLVGEPDHVGQRLALRQRADRVAPEAKFRCHS